MFKTEHLKPSDDYAAALVASEYEDLIFYDRPILFAGRNESGAHVVGSFVQYDRETRTEWYIHAVVTDEADGDFKARRIDYPALLRGADLYLVGWYGEELPKLFAVTLEDIPESYRPQDGALCPELTGAGRGELTDS